MFQICLGAIMSYNDFQNFHDFQCRCMRGQMCPCDVQGQGVLESTGECQQQSAAGQPCPAACEIKGWSDLVKHNCSLINQYIFRGKNNQINRKTTSSGFYRCPPQLLCYANPALYLQSALFALYQLQRLRAHLSVFSTWGWLPWDLLTQCRSRQISLNQCTRHWT